MGGYEQSPGYGGPDQKPWLWVEGGGADGSGAPSGERNGNYRHGFYTAEAIEERKRVRLWWRQTRGKPSL